VLLLNLEAMRPCKRELRELYAEHRAQTPWPRLRRGGRTPRNMLRRALGG